jgi:hypothetical protein
MFSGPSEETLWRRAYEAAAAYDAKVRERLQPDYWRIHRLDLFVDVCGPAKMREMVAAFWPPEERDRVAMFRRGNHVYVLGDSTWLPQWGLGHEIGHVLGYDVDHLSEGR